MSVDRSQDRSQDRARDRARDRAQEPLGDESVKSTGSSSTEGLPAIDETRPSDEDVAAMESLGKDEGARWSGRGSASQSRKKGVKDRVRGLKDKYVSCLHAIDGAGDMRSCAAGGAPCLAVPEASQHFDREHFDGASSPGTSAATLSTAAIPS